MSNFVNIADLKDPYDPEGRSYREVNNKRLHKLSVGDLVEVQIKDHESDRIRLYVTKLTRDCDGTPLYSLGESKSLLFGYGEDCLHLIKKA